MHEREREREREIERERERAGDSTTGFVPPLSNLSLISNLPAHPGPRQVSQLELLEEGIYWLIELVKPRGLHCLLGAGH